MNNEDKEIIAKNNICKSWNSDNIIGNSCAICKNNFCLYCCSKCYSDHCSLYYCNSCFSINKHQVRSSSLDCHFSRCKYWDTNDFVLLFPSTVLSVQKECVLIVNF